MRSYTLPALAVLFALGAACGGGEPAATPSPAEAPAEAEAPAAEEAEPLGDQLDLAALNTGSQAMTLVPSPRELQAALSAAGLQTALSGLVPERSWNTEQNDTDRVAVRTGVIIADMLLTVKTADDDTLIARLGQIRAGMKTLDGSSDIDATIGDLTDRIKAQAVDRTALLAELDELAQVAVPELEFHGQERIVPLIKAGSWLSGANLVATAATQDAKPAAASGLLKQPEVVAWFKGYVEAEEGKAPSEVAAVLDASLAKLETVATHEGPLGEPEVQTVVEATGAVMELL